MDAPGGRRRRLRSLRGGSWMILAGDCVGWAPGEGAATGAGASWGQRRRSMRRGSGRSARQRGSPARLAGKARLPSRRRARSSSWRAQVHRELPLEAASLLAPAAMAPRHLSRTRGKLRNLGGGRSCCWCGTDSQCGMHKGAGRGRFCQSQSLCVTRAAFAARTPCAASVRGRRALVGGTDCGQSYSEDKPGLAGRYAALGRGNCSVWNGGTSSRAQHGSRCGLSCAGILSFGRGLVLRGR